MTSTTASVTTASVTTSPVLDNRPLPIQNDSAEPSLQQPARDSVLSQSSTYAPSIFTFNASWRPDSLSQPSFLNAQTRQLTNSSGSGSSRSNGLSRTDGLGGHGGMDVHYEDAEEDRLSDASTFAEGNEDPFTDANADYLAGYGFPNGLGFDVPPDNLFDLDDEAGAHQYAYVYPSQHHRTPFYSPSPTAFEHEFPASSLSKNITGIGWERAFAQKGALDSLLGIMGLDERLRDDPLGVWEDMCWDVAAPETPVDSSEWDGARMDETDQSGLAANFTITADAHHAQDQGHIQSNEGDDIALRQGRENGADGGVTSPATTGESVVDANAQDSEQGAYDDVLDISPTAAAGASVTQDPRSPTESTVTETPADEWIAEAGARAQGRRQNPSLLRSTGLQPQGARPISATSQLGEHASFAQAMVRQRQPLSTTTPPLRLSMIARESVPMYGASVQDRLLLGDPPHDPPPYEAGVTRESEVAVSLRSNLLRLSHS